VANQRSGHEDGKASQIRDSWNRDRPRRSGRDLDLTEKELRVGFEMSSVRNIYWSLWMRYGKAIPRVASMLTVVMGWHQDREG
jgi:hypothetical protein